MTKRAKTNKDGREPVCVTAPIPPHEIDFELETHNAHLIRLAHQRAITLFQKAFEGHRHGDARPDLAQASGTGFTLMVLPIAKQVSEDVVETLTLRDRGRFIEILGPLR